MQINVTFRHMNSSPSVRGYVEEKLQKVKKYLNEPIEANVVLSTEKFRHTVDVNITANGGVSISGVEILEDLYAAIDNVTAKLERQIKKQLEKVKDTKIKPYQFKMHVLTAGEEKDEEESPRLIIKTAKYSAKPMSVEEAIDQLRTMKNDFIIFTNAETESVNVIYCRKDGNYGLIEPE